MPTRVLVSRRRRDSDHGAAAVEFALIAPLLIMLVFGVIGFGIIFAQQLALGNAARQGARLGVVGDRTCAEIVNETMQASKSINLPTPSVSVSIRRGTTEANAALTAGAVCPTASPKIKPCALSSPGENLYVEATYNSRLVVPLVVYNPTFPIGGTGVFRCEFSE